MNVLAISRLLWRRRLFVGLGALAAVALGFAIGGPKPSASALARTRVVLDTPKSQLIDSAPRGADTLPWRAGLLTHLMTTEGVKQALAQRLGVPHDQVAVVDPTLTAPIVQASLPQNAAETAARNFEPYVLTVFMKDASVPIISIEAAAPDRGGAARLAEAAVAVFKSDASPAGTYRSPVSIEGTRERQGFVVEDVAPVRTRALATSQVPLKALAASVFVFVVWSACVALFPSVARRTRLRRRLRLT